MREIKFRFWDRYNEKFRYFDLFEINRGYLNRGFSGLINEEYDIPKQYTGFKDRNGVEIYEGDILLWEKSLMYHEMDGEIQWIENGYYFVVPERNVKWHITKESLLETKVIGNIFEGIDK